MAKTMTTGRRPGQFSNNSRRFGKATEKVKPPMQGVMAKKSVAQAAGIIDEDDTISYDESDLGVKDATPAVEVKEAETISEASTEEKKTEEAPPAKEAEEGDPNVCTYCSAEYKTSRGLAGHVESKHSEETAEVGSTK